MTPHLELRDVSKSFGSTRALDRVSFELLPGEVHVLAGENGAGKSTLIKVLSGVVTDYAGELRLGGRVRRFRGPSDAAAFGVATIHQELSLVPSLSAIDNLSFAEPGRAFGRYDRRSARRRTEQAFGELELELDPERPVEELSLSERQLIEIARALTRDARILIMDEPTSALNENESERLFSHVERLRSRGAGIVYISHRLDEIERLANRVTVLRDGKSLFTRRASELSPGELVKSMLGPSSRNPPPARERSAHESPVLVEARNLSLEHALSGVSFSQCGGEIVGVAGLRGSGASALLKVMVGLAPKAAGELRIAGRHHRPRGPRAALGAGVAFVPGDRKLSVFPELAVLENATLSSLERYGSGPFVNRCEEARVVGHRLRHVELKAPSLMAPASALSGGNQQKLALLRALLAEPRLLVLDDPTRGVDVRAKAEIHAVLRELAAGGVAILIHASELEELVRVCDRVLVFVRGRLAATLGGAELTRERLLAAVMGAAA